MRGLILIIMTVSWFALMTSGYYMFKYPSLTFYRMLNIYDRLSSGNVGNLMEGFVAKSLPIGSLFPVAFVEGFTKNNHSVPESGYSIVFAWRTMNDEGSDIFKEMNTWEKAKKSYGKGRNYWRGLEEMHRITYGKKAENYRYYLLVVLKWNDTEREGNQYGSRWDRLHNDYDHFQYTMMLYPNFEIGLESEGYPISFSTLAWATNLKNDPSYSEMNGQKPECDPMAYHRYMRFSTSDRDNDLHPDKNCAGPGGAAAGHHFGFWWNGYKGLCGTTNMMAENGMMVEGYPHEPRCKPYVFRNPVEWWMIAMQDSCACPDKEKSLMDRFVEELEDIFG